MAERSSSTRQATLCEEVATRVLESDTTPILPASPLGLHRATSSELLVIVSAHPTRSSGGTADIMALCQVNLVIVRTIRLVLLR